LQRRLFDLEQAGETPAIPEKSGRFEGETVHVQTVYVLENLIDNGKSHYLYSKRLFRVGEARVTPASGALIQQQNSHRRFVGAMFMRKSFFAFLVVIFAFGGVFAQSPPTLKIVTETPNLPSDLFYGDIKVKPLRLRPGTNIPITIDDADFFAAQHYIDFLRRFPDAPGLVHWTGEITECSDISRRRPGESEPQCVDRKRTNTSAAFFLSPEFQNMGSFVIRVYWGTLGKLENAQCVGVPQNLPASCRPLYGDYIRDVAQISNGIVVNDALSPDVINANKRTFVEQFITRTEFQTAYGGLSAAQFVDKLAQTTGVALSSADRNALVTEAASNKASVVFKIVDGTQATAGGTLVFQTTYGQQFYNKEFDTTFVFMEYIGYLRRNPDQDGFNHWLGKLKFFGNWVDAEMVRSFVVSPEYRSRF